MSFEYSTHFYLAHFDPSRLTFGRELRGFTKKELADKVQRTSSLISQYEAGKTVPTIDIFIRILQVLGLPASFFSSATPGLPISSSGQIHFRANLRVSQTARYGAHNYGRLVFRIFSYLESLGVNFPTDRLPRYEHPDTENALEDLADQFRKDIGLGKGPIHNLAALLEGIGIRIILLPQTDVKLDGFAAWYDGKPCMMIDSDAPASRLQFNYAHELTHLVFDENNPPNDVLLERRANRFAGAFLMPRVSFANDCPAQYRQKLFQSVKNYWHVSIAAALFRARQLGIMSEGAYRSACINRNRQGLRMREEDEFEPSFPSLLGQALELVAKDVTLVEMAKALGLNYVELKEILKIQKVPEGILNKMDSTGKIAKIFSFPLTRDKE